MNEFWMELWKAKQFLWSGLGITIFVSLLSIAFGTILGGFLGLGLQYGPRFLKFFLRIYVDIIRGIPVLVQILASFFILPVVGLQFGPMEAGIFALSIFCSSHVIEITRGAFDSIPQTQVEAAKAIGLTFFARLRYVLFPQAIGRMLPPWVNVAVEIVKGSTLVSIIGVVDLILATQQIIARNFMALEFYMFAGLLYLIVNYTLSYLAMFLEKRTKYLVN